MRLYKILLAVTLHATLLMQPAEAQDGVTVTTQAELPCNADAKKSLRSICSFVSGQDSASLPQGRYVFLYQQKFLEAACVDALRDSEEVISQKISKIWKENESSLTCTNVQFDVHKGNVIKFAVSNNFNEFISDMIRWKVNLNKIDDSDGRTLLDYVNDLIVKNEGLKMQPTLKMYYKDLRKAGAKHANEL